MSVFPVLIDVRPAYGRSGDHASALRMPLGDTSVLAALQDSLRRVSDENWTILTDFEPTTPYREALLAAGGVERIEHLSALPRVVACFEPADQWLLLDVRRWPLEADDLHRLVREARRTHAVGHLVLSSSAADAQEIVHVDDRGRVSHIQRYYAGITWQRAAAVAASLITVSALRHTQIAQLTDLAALRRTLTAAGVVSRDVELHGPALDLSVEAGLLAMNARWLHGHDNGRTTHARQGAATANRNGVGVHPTARLYGPVVLHDDVMVGERATIIGPSVIGAGCRIGRNALLVQCLVCPGAVVEAGTTHRGRVLSGGVSVDHASIGDLGRPIARGRSSGGERTTASVGRAVYLRVKPVVEGLVAALGLLVLSPLLLAIAAGVKLTSRGPVLFGHVREGRNGRPFRCWKFRTMVHDAHRQQRALYRQNEVDGPQFKLRHDPRITRLGHWLRQTNLDELPQLINVVAGQMSLIGPRPSPFRENQICVPWRRARLSVRPGITGLWQICRHERAAGDFHQWIHYDMLYVRHLSFGLDLRILLATLLTFGGRWSVPVTWLIPARRLRTPQDVAPAYPAGRGLAAE